MGAAASVGHTGELTDMAEPIDEAHMPELEPGTAGPVERTKGVLASGPQMLAHAGRPTSA